MSQEQCKETTQMVKEKMKNLKDIRSLMDESDK